MLLENYKNKKVKLLVSSNSGAGISTGNLARERTISSTIVIIGKITDFDDEYIELSYAKVIRMNLHADSDIIGTEDFDSMLINKKSIITISVI